MVIVKIGRGAGKTEYAIKESARTGSVIVALDIRELKEIKFRAKEMGLKIPEPTTYHYLVNGTSRGKDVNYIFENLELYLWNHLNVSPKNVHAITMTNYEKETQT